MVRAAVLFSLGLMLTGGRVERTTLRAQPAAPPVQYRFTFPDLSHRWMQVEATFAGVEQPALELRMSRSSPGRYSLHDFAKNVYDVHAFAADGREIETTRPDPYGWNVAGFGGRVTVKYKVYGDRVDGTYLAIDETHAHLNMPAVIMWAHGLETRAAAITFEQPPGLRWHVATQLHGAGLEFTAPNLQYLMDSPAEFGTEAIREFSVDGRRFRVSMHHTGSDGELDAYVKDVEKIVRQEGRIYGEFPEYEPGHYTFIVDYLPYANGDGMEHRNSTVISESATLRDRTRLLDTVAHEFFHCWNVERIRPKGLEPFDFDRANMSDSLWLAEGFTQYYGPLTLQRAALAEFPATLRSMERLVSSVTLSPAHLVRSAADMSRMAPFIDGGRTVDPTNWPITVTSYYSFGGAIALALDLSLRGRSNGEVSLDDYMRAMWRSFGKPGGSREGYVDRPYTIGDAEATLAEVSGDRAFAHDFFARYILGHEVADYRPLLDRAGLTIVKRRAGRAWLGDLDFEGESLRVASLVAPGWPVYATGLEQHDVLQRLDGRAVASAAEVDDVLGRRKPGDRVELVFVDRSGAARTATVALAEDPRLEVVAAESHGGTITPAQKTFRDRWLGLK